MRGSRKEGEGGRTVEGTLVGDIVDEKDAHRAAVVGGRDRPETFLAGRVPLQASVPEPNRAEGLGG